MKFPMAAAIALGLALAPAWLRAQDQAKAKDQDKGKAAPAGAPALKDARQKTSYGIGLDIGRNYKRAGVDLDVDLFLRGLKDGLAGARPPLTDAEIQEAVKEYQTGLKAKLAEKNKKEGAEFLAANKKKPGVKTTESGLQYKVLTEGDGPTPKATDTVKANYRGTLIDGTEFDSSYKRGQPATFAVNGVIRGWTEALQMMKVGSKWQVFIPSDLAYGPDPGRVPLPPNATLIFEIELLGIENR